MMSGPAPVGMSSVASVRAYTLAVSAGGPNLKSGEAIGDRILCELTADSVIAGERTHLFEGRQVLQRLGSLGTPDAGHTLGCYRISHTASATATAAASQAREGFAYRIDDFRELPCPGPHERVRRKESALLLGEGLLQELDDGHALSQCRALAICQTREFQRWYLVRACGSRVSKRSGSPRKAWGKGQASVRTQTCFSGLVEEL